MHENKRFARKKSKKRNAFFIRIAALAIPLVCTLLLLSQTAFAQNTYVITDGSRVLVHTSSATDPKAILGEAGLELDKDDTYTTQAGNGVSEITIRRSRAVTIDHCGETLEVTSLGETVEQLLSRLNIPLDGNTKVSVPLDSETYEGMAITISQTVRTQETYTTTIAHEVKRYYDPSLPAGAEKVLAQGQDGQMLCTANVVYVNGQEESRTVTQQTVSTQPMAKIVAVGSGVADLEPEAVIGETIIGDGYIITPTGEVLTYRKTLKMKATAYTHTDEGCDMITATGTTVRVGTVAIDPKVVAYGTRMFVVTNDGQYIYGIATAEDCGGGIKGNRIDLYFPTTRECFDFGVRQATIYILGN